MNILKNIVALLLITALFIGCKSNDDDFYNTVYLHGTGFVVIDTKPTFLAGDQIFISSTLPKLLTESNYTEKLDVYKTSGYANSFKFTFLIERKNETSNEWEAVLFNPKQLNIQKGNASATNYYIDARAVYNQITENYEFLGGFPLLQKGEYRIKFNDDENTHEVGIVSEGNPNHLKVIVLSKTAYLNAEGFYYFTVN